jgi:hypothetical protein
MSPGDRRLDSELGGDSSRNCHDSDLRPGDRRDDRLEFSWRSAAVDLRLGDWSPAPRKLDRRRGCVWVLGMVWSRSGSRRNCFWERSSFGAGDLARSIARREGSGCLGQARSRQWASCSYLESNSGPGPCSFSPRAFSCSSSGECAAIRGNARRGHSPPACASVAPMSRRDSF